MRRQPHQIFLCFWCVLAGVLFLAGIAPPPGSISRLLPVWVVWGWYLLLTAGGLAGVVGAFWPRRRLYTGLQLERASMLFLSSGTCMYMIAMICAAGVRATGAAGFLAAWGAACIWRAAQIHGDLTVLTRASRYRPPS